MIMNDNIPIFTSSTSQKVKTYKVISIEELKRKDQDTYIQICGTELSLEVSLLDKGNLEDSANQKLLDLYYQYLLQGKKDGYSSPYIETQLKNVISLFEKFFKHAAKDAFRELVIQ